MSALEWWLARTALPEPPRGAPRVAHERARQSRLASIVLLTFLCALGCAATATRGYSLAWYVIGSVALAMIVALGCTRSGATWVAGAIVVPTLAGAVVFGMFVLPGSAFDLAWMFIVPELTALVFMPPATVFAVTAAGVAFTIVFVEVLPVHPTEPLFLVELFAILQMVVASASFVWVGAMNRALNERDQAEELAALREHEIRLHADLEAGIRALLTCMTATANGDATVRAPLIRGSILFPVAVSLNTLLSRLDDQTRSRARARQQIRELIHALRQIERGESPQWPVVSGMTETDKLVIALREHSATLPSIHHQSRPLERPLA